MILRERWVIQKCFGNVTSRRQLRRLTFGWLDTSERLFCPLGSLMALLLLHGFGRELPSFVFRGFWLLGDGPANFQSFGH
jgi:hypothetical protein